MSTIKSSAEDLTLDADGGSSEIKLKINNVEKASISSAGAFTSTTIDATALTGNLPAISGASLTSLNASNLGSGTVADARLGTVPVNKGGTGATTHTSNNVLVGNGTSAIGSVAPSTSGNVLTSNGSSWASTAPAGGGKCLSVVSTPLATIPTTTSTSWVDISGFSVTTGTLDSTSSKLLIWVMCMAGTTTSYNGNVRMKITPSGGSAVYPFVGSGAPDSASRWNHSLMHGYSFSAASTLASTETLVYLYSVSSTVAHTVQMQWLVESGGEIYLNRSITEDYGRGVSSVTIMEIGA